MSKLVTDSFRLASVFLILLTCGVIFVTQTQPIFAQGGAATLNGTITDPSGATVPGATVTIKNLSTGEPRTVTASTDGGFVAPFLPVGEYSVTVSHPGFKSKTQTGITLTTDQVATVNISLEVGAVTQSVEVTGSAQVLQTTTAAIGSTVNSSEVVELPLNGRDPASLAFLATGAYSGVMTSAMELSNKANGLPTETNAVVNGSRLGGVFYMLDGIQHMDIYLQTAQPFPNADATQEFQVITNNFDAQYGFAPGGVVSISTKTGTNQWHGNLFEFVRNNDLDSADFFSHETSGLKRNQFGGSLGGPIKKDKAFIFGNLQFTQERTVAASNQYTVPTQAMLEGDFSAVPVTLTNPTNSGVVIGPNPSTGAPNYINPSNFSPVMLNFEKLLPVATNPTGLIYVPGPELKDYYREFTIRHDLNLNDKNRIMVRAFYQRYVQPDALTNNDWLQAATGNIDRDQSYGGSWTFTPTPSLVNNFVFGFTIGSAVQTSPWTGKTWQSLGATDIPSPDNNLAWVNASGFGPNFYTGIANHKNYTINDTISWTKGKHLIVAGVNVLTNFNIEEAAWLADPLVTFNGAVTGSWYSDFLLGYMQSYEQGGGEYNKYAGKLWAGFGQDTIRLKPNLTLNLGVRWEPEIAPHPIPEERMAMWDPGHQSTEYPNAPENLVFRGDAGIPTGGWNSEFNSIVPRLGFAWQPHALHNTSIRSAFGMFTMPYDYSYYNHIGSNAPWSPTYYLTTATAAPYPLSIDNPFQHFPGTGNIAPFPPFGLTDYVPPTTAAFLTPVGVAAAFDPANFVLPRELSWNFTVEHQFATNWLVSVGYVGTESYHLATPIDQNPGIYADAGDRTRYPNYGLVLIYEPEGTASYNGLQFSVKKQFSHGVQFTSNYAYSKELDEASGSSIGGPEANSSNPFDFHLDRGISALNFTNLWSNMGVWQLPKLAQYNPFTRAILGAWELSGTMTWDSGVPFSINGGSGNDNSEDQESQDRADLTGQPFNVRQGSKAQYLHEYFNTAAFQENAAGTFGDSARNLFKGPRHFDTELAMVKNFPFKERYSAQFRWEMFNAFNNAYFSTPDNSVGDTTFGQITSSVTPNCPGCPASVPNARVMQIALKLFF